MARAKLQIAGEDTIKSVQMRFSDLYPYLKINFFKSQGGRVTRQSGMVSPDLKVKEINRQFIDSIYEFGENTSVAGFEKAFNDKFGLAIQISRLSGNLWMETSLTDHLTLKEQNELGKEITLTQQPPAYFKNIPN